VATDDLAEEICSHLPFPTAFEAVESEGWNQADVATLCLGLLALERHPELGCFRIAEPLAPLTAQPTTFSDNLFGPFYNQQILEYYQVMWK
jgi:hypothetical protein